MAYHPELPGICLTGSVADFKSARQTGQLYIHDAFNRLGPRTRERHFLQADKADLQLRVLFVFQGFFELRRHDPVVTVEGLDINPQDSLKGHTLRIVGGYGFKTGDGIGLAIFTDGTGKRNMCKGRIPSYLD